ncbi:hypothetical protein JHK87_016154 [Glycine soja]|nr:hypothetical protein JHK87_016154 [Glycine soja]
MDDDSTKGIENASLNSTQLENPQIEPIGLPSVEEIRGQDIWNNCVVCSVVSGFMSSSDNTKLFCRYDAD